MTADSVRPPINRSSNHAAAPSGALANIPISDIKIGKRFRKELGDIEELARSIEEYGLLLPIAVDEDYNLIGGERRIKAFELLGLKQIPAHIIPIPRGLLLKAQLEENNCRKDLTYNEMWEVGQFIESIFSAEAEERKVEAGKKYHRGSKKGCADSAPPLEKTRDRVADYLGIGHDTWGKMKFVHEAIENDPEKFGHLNTKLNVSHLHDKEEGHTSLNEAFNFVNRHQRATPPPLPAGKYDVWLVDPPYDYDFGLSGSPSMHYPTMPAQEIADLEVNGVKVRDMVAPDAALFLWAPGPKLLDALVVMEKLGFKYKTLMVWVKKNAFGLGYYCREQQELLLIGTKGKMHPPLEENRPPSVIFADRREHSRKPDEVYELIEKMYPEPWHKRLELFARYKRKGWVSWGAGLDGGDERA